ncbi:MAG: hypothetical protein IJQ81_16525 [Oscillibacter sp.]|nr:hypothetical protein [Oscillibacter sp.]
MLLAKLHSKRGASLIVTLFLLLVCSTVGSIILTAATANIGRISERAEYDRKYYKVISAARLFADKMDGKEITLKFFRPSPDVAISAESPPAIPEAGDKLSAFLQKAVYDIYTGRQSSDKIATIAKNYWEYDFGNIGSAANNDEIAPGGGESLPGADESAPNYRESDPTAFTIEVRENGADTSVLSTVYGRFGVEAKRMRGDINSSLDSVEHSVTAVFYSDEDTDGQIPENAYVVKLVCLADVVYPALQENAGGETMLITFRWQRDNMKIEQVRGVA